MTGSVIVAARRTAVGSFLGAFANVPAHELGRVAILAAMADAGVAGDEIDEVILGQVLTAGQGQNPARQAAMAAGIAQETPAWGVNQVCGSGLRAVGLAAQAIALTPSLTLGDEIMVPADAEIVIEGWAHPGQLEADGPFGEFTGYLGPQVLAPVIEVTAITHRRGAIYHDYGSGLVDMLVPDNMAMEGKLFGLIRQIAPSLRNVHVPSSGRRLHAWLQLEDPGPGEARDALAAAMSYRRLKTVAAFDMDVDIFDESSVMWGLATRVQWDRDVLRVDGLSTSTLDPSLAAGARTAPS